MIETYDSSYKLTKLARENGITNINWLIFVMLN